MKIRIKGNSIRLRLTKTDVANFAQTGKVAEHTEFIDSCFTYSLVRSREQQMAATFQNNSITLSVPEAMAKAFTETDQIGMESHFETLAGKSLFLLVEKDFACLDHSREDQSDMYINPNKHC